MRKLIRLTKAIGIVLAGAVAVTVALVALVALIGFIGPKYIGWVVLAALFGLVVLLVYSIIGDDE